MNDTIRILAVDDHDLVRRGLRSLFEITPGMELIAEAVDGVEAVTLAQELKPDVILLDLMLPLKDGIQVTREIKNSDPDSRILILTSFAEDDKVFAAVKAGALGYLLKDSSPDELIQAIHDVNGGMPSLQPAIARKLLREISAPPSQPPTEDPLTEREVSVLTLVAQGKSNLEIAEELFITEGTVRYHVSNILGKLHLANRTQAALYALREGLASLNGD